MVFLRNRLVPSPLPQTVSKRFWDVDASAERVSGLVGEDRHDLLGSRRSVEGVASVWIGQCARQRGQNILVGRGVCGCESCY